MLRLSIARLRNRWIRNRLQGKELAPLAYENLSALDHLDLKQRAKNMRYVILDLETTGLSLTHDRVVSLSAVRVVDGRIPLGDVFSSLVNPGQAIPFSTIKIHGIVPSMVARAPLIEEVIDQFLRYLGTDILVGYHVRFDLNFLNYTNFTSPKVPIPKVLPTSKSFIDNCLICYISPYQYRTNHYH